MYGFLIGVGVLLLFSIIWMVYRIQTLVSVVKGSDKKIASGSNKVNAILFIVFLVGTGILMFWYSIKEFDNYQLPVASEHGVITDKLFWITMAVTGVVFLITHILLFVFPYKYQYKENRKLLSTRITTILKSFGLLFQGWSWPDWLFQVGWPGRISPHPHLRKLT